MRRSDTQKPPASLREGESRGPGCTPQGRGGSGRSLREGCVSVRPLRRSVASVGGHVRPDGGADGVVRCLLGCAAANGRAGRCGTGVAQGTLAAGAQGKGAQTEYQKCYRGLHDG